ncbi:MAG: class I SAM-dependent methyltransferase [Candidatus Omnitrophica bacterium]|nr:class I SAM-dependent methyltransferase [Candidatus Omnitrophota bacterium]
MVQREESCDKKFDHKFRFRGLLENPIVSNVQRAILDAGRVQGLRRALKPYDYASVLDVGCGLGEGSAVSKGFYCGLDNSVRRIQYAAHNYSKHFFLVGDALKLPFAQQSFDVAMLVDTAHHLDDQQFRDVLLELKKVSRKYVVVSDPVFFENQGKISTFFYRLDRGACFRTVEQMRKIFATIEGLELVKTESYQTFPGLYCHTTFILER